MSTPLGKQWSYAYDASGNLTSVVDANGNATGTPGDGTTSLTYDQIDRLTAIDFSDSTPDVSFAYDANSNRSSMSDGLTGSETRSYDRLTSVTRGSDTFAYEYDPANNLTKRTYPGSIDTDYTHDDDERLASVTANSATTSYGYDEAGNVTTITLPSANGHLEARVFDRSGRLTDVWNKTGSTTLSRFQVTLDPVGNPTQIVRSGTPSETRKYLYDNMDRLTEVCFQAAACSGGSDPFIRWVYDGVGNRLTETRPTGTTSYSYDNDDRLTTAGSTSYSFDHNGNQTIAGSRSFTWDLANRLVSTTLSGTTTSYTYSGDGRRSSSTTGAASNTNLWDVNHELPQLAIQRDGSGVLLRRNTYGLDRLAMSTATGTFYYHYDDLRSVANLTNTSGTKQWTYSYEPYGGPKTETQDNANAPINPMKFTGEQLDPTGHYHLRARQYDPTQGFISRDPLPPAVGEATSSSFAYADARPTVLLDPSGMSAVSASGACEGATDARRELAAGGLPRCSSYKWTGIYGAELSVRTQSKGNRIWLNWGFRVGPSSAGYVSTLYPVFSVNGLSMIEPAKSNANGVFVQVGYFNHGTIPRGGYRLAEDPNTKIPLKAGDIVGLGFYSHGSRGRYLFVPRHCRI